LKTTLTRKKLSSAAKVANTLMLAAILKRINALAKASRNLNKPNLKATTLKEEIKILIKIYDAKNL
jgi:hypothetical protein